MNMLSKSIVSCSVLVVGLLLMGLAAILSVSSKSIVSCSLLVVGLLLILLPAILYGSSKSIVSCSLLAVGLLLILLPAILYGSYVPAFDGFIFNLALLLYFCDTHTNRGLGLDDVDNIPRYAADRIKWLSGFLVVCGLALPVTLCRNKILLPVAGTLPVLGGACISVTMIFFRSHFDTLCDPSAT